MEDAGICFSITCNSDERNRYKIDDNNCKQYCNIVWQWANNKDPNPRSLKPENIDIKRFADICGVDFKAYNVVDINRRVFYALILQSIMITFMVTLILKRKKINLSVIILTVSLIFVGLMIFSYYMGKDFSGLSRCVTDKKTGYPMGSECVSNITKRKIPDRYCKYKQACECYFNEDGPKSTSKACGGNCKCINTTCMSLDNRKRNKITITKKDVKIYETIYLIILCIVCVIIYNLLRPNEEKYIKMIISLVIVLIYLIIIVIINSGKRTEEILKKNCGPIPSPEPDTDTSE